MFHSNIRNNRIEKLKLRLKSETKLKIGKEKQILNLRNSERSIREELYCTKTEIDFLTEHLEELKDKVSDTAYQISRTQIFKMAETSKIDTRIGVLDAHKKGFHEMFDRKRDLSELRNKELKEKEAEEEESERQRQKQIDEKNEQQAREAAAIDQKCEAIERECCVLKEFDILERIVNETHRNRIVATIKKFKLRKKRNNAIMLKLRRKLVETEDARRQLMKKMGISNENAAETTLQQIPDN